MLGWNELSSTRMNAAELDWTNISSTAFGRACLECVQWVWVRLERTWLGLDGLSWRRRGVEEMGGGVVGFCRLEWGQLGLAQQGCVGLNCDRLDSDGIS